MTRVSSIVPPADTRDLLPSASFADSFVIEVDDTSLDAMTAARRMFGEFPGWIRRLLALRDALVTPFGVMTSTQIRQSARRRIGTFPLLSESPGRVVVGADDKHLNFVGVVDVISGGGAAPRVVLTTLVDTHNLLGRVYLSIVMPFHRVIAPALLKRLARA